MINPQNLPKPAKTRHISNEKQAQAIELLLSGRSDADIAGIVGVSRQTVGQWRLHDPAFQSRLDERRRELWGPYVDRLDALMPAVLETIERHLSFSDNLKLAMQLVDMLGLGTACRANVSLSPPEPRPPWQPNPHVPQSRARRTDIDGHQRIEQSLDVVHQLAQSPLSETEVVDRFVGGHFPRPPALDDR
ncbi:MAG TPA: helix-turn-helix domain-containing protein [Chloroflexota bacterium]|jgi:hypothetical protein|nr:helix-turn-helix domain-containing protein [Chloroflexota bacterium]